MKDKVREIIVKQITQKKELANAKAILTMKDLDEQTISQHSVEEIMEMVDSIEMFYYIGYKQALNDVLASFAGEKYKFTEYEETCLVLD